MDKIIFLDIDGVLNCSKTFDESSGIKKAYNQLLKDKTDYHLLLQETLLDIDIDKLSLLKNITDLTDAKIVISSSWRLLRLYPLVEEYLITYGLPVVGTTKKMKNRGEEINNFIEENQVKRYVILDDEIFEDFTEEQKYNLVKTSFYLEGLNEEYTNDAINILGLKN